MGTSKRRKRLMLTPLCGSSRRSGLPEEGCAVVRRRAPRKRSVVVPILVATWAHAHVLSGAMPLTGHLLPARGRPWSRR
jgi:hypothetical protein